MMDLIVNHATHYADGRQVSIAVQGDTIVEMAPRINTPARTEIDAEGALITPPFVDSHFHLDATLSYGIPRVNRSGTLLEGIRLWGELKQQLNPQEVYDRAYQLCCWAIARGNLAIRSHVDVSDTLVAVEPLLQLRRDLAPFIDIQLVAFPQDGFLRAPQAQQTLRRALDMGLDVIGGIPHFERTMADGAQSVQQLCAIAAERGLCVDLHCDESDDPLSRHVETLAQQTILHGLQGRVAASHLTSMHSMDNYYVSKLLPLIEEAQLHVIANPLINITLQGRHDTFPKRRGLTRVKEMFDWGINVAFGHDCVMDPWYALGSHDMLEVAQMGLHVAQMTAQDEMQACFRAVTENPAGAMGLQRYGLQVGNYADFVLLDCRSVIDAIRLRPTRLYVFRRGKIVSRTTKAHPQVQIGDKQIDVDFLLHR